MSSMSTSKAKTDDGKAVTERLDAIYTVLRDLVDELRAIKLALKPEPPHRSR